MWALAATGCWGLWLVISVLSGKFSTHLLTFQYYGPFWYVTCICLSFYKTMHVQDLLEIYVYQTGILRLLSDWLTIITLGCTSRGVSSSLWWSSSWSWSSSSWWLQLQLQPDDLVFDVQMRKTVTQQQQQYSHPSMYWYYCYSSHEK